MESDGVSEECLTDGTIQMNRYMIVYELVILLLSMSLVNMKVSLFFSGCSSSLSFVASRWLRVPLHVGI